MFERRVLAEVRCRLVFKGLLLHKVVDFFETLSEIAHKTLQSLHTGLISATFVQILLQRLDIVQFATLELRILKDIRDRLAKYVHILFNTQLRNHVLHLILRLTGLCLAQLVKVLFETVFKKMF